MRVCALLLLVLLPGSSAMADDRPAAAAQSDRATPRRSAPDFLFGPPRGSVGVRGSWTFARAGSDFYDFVSNTLTLGRRDFDAPGIAADLALPVTGRLEVMASVEYGQVTASSEYRHLVDNNRLPIEQTTSLRQTHVSGSVRYSLTPRGREVSNFSWIPAGVTPYVGAGAGVMFFRLRQYGDFVDYVDSGVFTDTFQSQGWAPTAQAFGGVDLRVARRLYTTLDARYVWARGRLNRQFVDFDRLDLAGLRLSAGLRVLF